MAIFTYVVVWWITLLPVLSLGVTHAEDKPKEHYAGAPDRPDLKKKLLINSVAALLVVLAIHLLLRSGVIPLRKAME